MGYWNNKPALLGLLPCLITALACGLDQLSLSSPTPVPTATLVVARFSTPQATFTVSPSTSPTETFTPLPTDTATRVVVPTETPSPVLTTPENIATEVILPTENSPTPEPAPIANASGNPSAQENYTGETSSSEAQAAPSVDFSLRLVRMRTNAENSWDGTLGAGGCGSDHSIYVHVADAQENLLDGVLIGDKFGNFQVPTGVDGPGAVRILVWSATMELSVVGQHPEGRAYTSDFTPPLSTLDEAIPLDWLEAAGYCESPDNCQWRVENNQLCRGHYSYDVIFQRTW